MPLCECFERFQKIGAVVRIDLNGERLGEVEAENAEDGFTKSFTFCAISREILTDFIKEPPKSIFYIIPKNFLKIKIFPKNKLIK